jgi:diaminopimelate epimerase
MKFIKAETNGNDFIILENIDLDTSTIIQISDRRYGIGADQIISFKKISKNIYDVKFFNSDGSEADMCGNGLCALTKFLRRESTFIVKGQEYTGQIENNEITSLTIPPPNEILCGHNYKIIDVGNKHIVFLSKQQAYAMNQSTSSHIAHLPFVNRKEKIKLRGLWSRWQEKRTLSELKEQLTQLSDFNAFEEYNIHFVDIIKDGSIRINSYEKGSGHTLSCGSGAVACAFAYGNTNGENYIKQKGGESYVEFLENGKVILKTKPRIVFTGEIHI